MKQYIVITMLACATGAHAQTPQKSASECGVEPLGKYMKLTFEQFDQTLDAGWRVIGDKTGCELAAADVIAAYRENMMQNIASLDWHEGQVRAAGGETAKAIELFQRNVAYKKSVRPQYRSDADILYGEATLAFLERDLARLKAKRAELAALPKPDGFDVAIANFKQRFPGQAPPAWPTNLDTVDGLIACFDKPYAEAYKFSCRPQPN